MRQVKLFRSSSTAELERRINEWMADAPERVVNISISEDDSGFTAALLIERSGPSYRTLDVVEEYEDPGEPESDEELDERDVLFRQAAELCIQHEGGSAALLQRRLRIGYGRAARIVDQLHFAGVLGPPGGSKPREVQVDFTQLDSICGDT
jgi:DNA segregation ATPase FtsK/SpoIIIE-like protein